MAIISSQSLQRQLSDLYRQYVNDAGRGTLTKAGGYQKDSSDFSQTEITPLYSFQNILRSFYNKGEPQLPDIGDHPDFRHLKGTSDCIYCPITTLFMDLEGSTRLSLLYPLEKVQRIKNAFIRATIEIIKAFDGHVHRIMGDAVMAFFGGFNMSPECAAVDAVNCAAILQLFVEKSVRPMLSGEGLDDPFGIRIGIDYGSEENVLWSSYGYPGMDEVTATSFYVDVASKLQHSAGRNQIMIGQSLKQLLDFPDDLLNIKTIQKNGTPVPKVYLEPNHTDRDGEAINYKQFLLDWDTYLLFSPFTHENEHFLTSAKEPRTIPMSVKVYSEKTGEYECNYKSCSTLLHKGKSLIFKPEFPYMPMLPYTVKFIVENHGEEAEKANNEIDKPYGNHEKTHYIRTQQEHKQGLTHQEHTEYRGLHYMLVEVHTHQGLSHRTRIGVYVN